MGIAAALAADAPNAVKILGKIKKTVRYAFWDCVMINMHEISLSYAQEVFFMRKKKSKKKSQIRLVAVAAALVVTAAALFAGRHMIVQEIKTKAAVEIGKKIFEGQMGKNVNIGGADIDVSGIAGQLEDQDVQQVTEIAEKYISPENIQQAASLAASGDMEGLQALAEGQVTEEDRAKLEELYEKYKGLLENYVSQ